MAGMLPGVECARRRRFHQSIAAAAAAPHHGGSCPTRRSYFCLYTSNHDFHHTSTSSLKTHQRNMNSQAYHDEELGGIAREAKERLDDRLRSQTLKKTDITRREGFRSSTSSVKGRGKVVGTEAYNELQTEVFGYKKSGAPRRRFSWIKFGWKALDQEECAVCLEQFRVGETLLNLPCAHRFHSKCLVPWLENNGLCPCCRMGIIYSTT